VYFLLQNYRAVLSAGVFHSADWDGRIDYALPGSWTPSDGDGEITDYGTKGWALSKAGDGAFNGSIMSGGEIVGAIFKTSTTGQRVVIEDDSVKFYDTAGTLQGTMYAIASGQSLPEGLYLSGPVGVAGNLTFSGTLGVGFGAEYKPFVNQLREATFDKVTLANDPTAATDVGNRAYNDIRYSRYLGSFAGDPSSGTTGDLYYNYLDSKMKIKTPAAWVAIH